MVGSTFESVQVILMAIDEILAGESKNVEFKVQRPEKSIKYMKTVVAFANGKGGQIIFGIDDKTRNVVGIPELMRLQMLYRTVVSLQLFRMFI